MARESGKKPFVAIPSGARRADIPDLPRLDTTDEKGAVDIRLAEPNGDHVKVGLISLERKGQTALVPLDPNTRRFRLGGLSPGKYLARAAASAFGSGTKSIEIRPSDITRTEIQLDGRPAEGETPLKIAVSGHTGNSIRVRILDQRTGRYVLDNRADVVDGYVKFDRVPLGYWHIDIIDDSGATSCYDTDAGDRGLVSHIPLIVVAIDPAHLTNPNPPDPAIDPFFGLAQEYQGLVGLLPELEFIPFANWLRAKARISFIAFAVLQY